MVQLRLWSISGSGLPSHDRTRQAERSIVLPSAGVVDSAGPYGLPGKDGRRSFGRTCRHGRLYSPLHPDADRSNPPSCWLASRGVLCRQPPPAQDSERSQRGRKPELLGGSAARLRTRGTGPAGRDPSPFPCRDRHTAASLRTSPTPAGPHPITATQNALPHNVTFSCPAIADPELHHHGQARGAADSLERGHHYANHRGAIPVRF